MVEMVKNSMSGNHKISSDLKICTYNIQSGGINRLEQVLRCMRMMNIDIGFLTETKLIQGFHTQGAEGYEVIATEARSRHQGGVALCYRKSANFHIEGTSTVGPNVISATLVSGRKRWRMLGVYIPPSEEDGSTLEFVQRAATAATSRMPLILLGDLNVDLKNIQAATGGRRMETVALVSTLGLIDLNQQFMQRQGIGDWTWSQRREGRRIVSRCDYILATDMADFRAFRIKEPRFATDHRMLVSVLRVDCKRQHRKYVRGRTRYPVQTRPEDRERADDLMEELAALITKPCKIDPQYKSWISDTSWGLVSAKAEVRRCGDVQLTKSLARRLRRSLKTDRRRRVEATAVEIEALLLNNAAEAAYGRLRGWYRKKSGHVPKPTFQDEERTRSEYQALYTAEEPPGEPLPVHYTVTRSVEDSPPTEQEVCAALKGMKCGKSPGGSGMRVEHLKEWMNGAHAGEHVDPMKAEAWAKVLELVELAFTGKPLPSSFSNGILVLIPKGEPGQYRGIALLEVIYKLVSMIIHINISKINSF